MQDNTENRTSHIQNIQLDDLDISILVGNEIIIFSEQLGGQPLKSRVSLVNGRTITVDRSGNSGRVDSMVNNQVVTLRFKYKGESVAIKGTIKKSQGGNCNILLEENALPLAQRKFDRFNLNVPVKMARLTIKEFDKTKIAKLRWMQTETVNISAGGMLLELSGFLKSDNFLILNLTTEEFEFPSLALGQIRYCLQSNKTSYRTGVEFVTKEMSANNFEVSLLKKFPPVVLEFDEQSRTELKNELSHFSNNNA